MITSHSDKKCSLHCNIQTKVRHKSSLLLNERAQCSFKVSGKIGCCWASFRSSPLNGLVCLSASTLSHHPVIPFRLLPPHERCRWQFTYLQKYFCCTLLSCLLSLEWFVFNVRFKMQTNSLDQTKVLTSLCKRETNHGGFHGFQL